ncbi:MAG: diaminopimelate dehydrogenase [Clostridia bacterium]
MKIKIGIVGYGNIGKSIENEIEKFIDIELVGIFTRRNIKEVKCCSKKIYSLNDIQKFKGKIDVVIMCLGSENDLTSYTYAIAKDFNTIDCYDNHSKIYDYFKQLNKINKKNNTVSIIGAGWDPGIFSYFRTLSDSIIPESNTYTFWGTGVSQGHSEALRRIKGVKNAIEYTIPNEDAIKKVKNNENPIFKARDKHTRKCFVVLQNDNDLTRKNIEKQIKNMPNYFAGYDTTVQFITEEEFNLNHNKMPHGGNILTSGITGIESRVNMELLLKLESNPEFTAGILISYSRAVYRLSIEKKYATYTTLDIPMSYISKEDNKYLIRNML